MRSLAARLSGIPEETGQAPWPDHESVRGWGVFGLPFDSGHVLALRVFPQSTFGSYRTVWRRDPEGHRAIYADAPDLELACPRYDGPACAVHAQGSINLTWTGRRRCASSSTSPR